MSELGRRAVHAAGGVVPLAYLAGVVDWRAVQLLLVAGTLCVAVLEFLRLRGVLESRLYDALIREYEREDVAAYVLYAVGMTVTAWVVPPRAAVPAMLLLAFADPVSGLLASDGLGVKRGYVLLATFGVSVLIASAAGVPPWPAVAGGVATAVADGVKPVVAGYVLDDDFTIPVASGVAIEAAWRLL